MTTTNSPETSVLPIIGYDRQARFVYDRGRPLTYGYPERQATVLTSDRAGRAALEGCLELAEHGAGLMNPDGQTPTKAEIRQFLTARIKDPNEFHHFLNRSSLQPCDTGFRRYSTPLFQAQFKGFDREPEKQQLILDAIDRFQRLQTDAEGCYPIYEESGQLFELEAGQ